MDHPQSPSTYNVLHNVMEGEHSGEGDNMLLGEGDPNLDDVYEEEDYDEMDYHDHRHKHKHEEKKVVFESFDFNDVESLQWRKVSHFDSPHRCFSLI